MILEALFLAGLAVFVLGQVAILTILGARRDGCSPLTKEFWT